jgi:NAD+ synthase (glutamine-hydrolysing)
MNCTIALAQVKPVLGDLRRNVALHVEQATAARAAGASLVVFPELSLTGYTVRDSTWDLAVRVDAPRAELEPLLEVGRSIPVIAGAIEEHPSFGLHNAAMLFSGGTMQVLHRKIYPPTYGMFEELRYFSPGDSVRAHDLPCGRVGVLICEDLWHPSLPYLLAQDGAEVIVALVASPTRVAGSDPGLAVAAVNRENHRVYARLLSCYVAFCNRVGYEDGVNFWGGSGVTGPDGEPVAVAPLFDEHLLLAPLRDEELRRSRQLSRHFLDERSDVVLRELERLRGGRT